MSSWWLLAVTVLAVLVLLAVYVARTEASTDLAIAQARLESLREQRESRGGVNVGAVLGALASIAATVVGAFSPPAGAAIAVGAAALSEAG
jgi:hypothetical protein